MTMNEKSVPLKERIITEKFYYYFIITLMIAVPVSEFISELVGVQFSSQQVIVALYGVVGIVSVMFFFFEKLKAPLFYPSDIFFVSLLFFAVISLMFTQNSLSGTGGSGEWLIHYVAYFSLMFAGTMICGDKLRKNVLYVFAAAAAFNVLTAFPQSFGLRLMDCATSTKYHNLLNAIFGLTQNCNYFAGLCTLFIGLSAGLFIFSEKGKEKWLALVLYALCFYCAIGTTTRIAWLGILGVLFFYAVSFIVMKKAKYDGGRLKSHLARYGIIAAVSAAVFAYFAVFTDVISQSLLEILSEMNVDFEQFGSKRGYIWKYAFEAVPKYWLTGVGLDNFYHVFISNPKWDQVYSAPRAHNEYIQTLVTQGVLAAVNYIAMLVYSCVTGVKTVLNTENNEKRKITWILLGMFAGYAVQALANSSVINVAPYFWITVGMTMPKSEQKALKRKS